jgi:hypothetical protein
MSRKIIKLVRNTGVVWIFDEDAAEEYGEATLIYGVTHVKRLTGDVYEIKNGPQIVSLQFGVKEIREEW